MARDSQFVLKYLEEVELSAEDVLTDKQQIVDLDKKRNSNREAIAALHKNAVAPPYSENKAWLNFGGIFLKMKKDDAISMLQSDQNELNCEIEKVRKGLKSKVNKLRDAQNHPELKGFDLQALSPEESRQVVSRTNRV